MLISRRSALFVAIVITCSIAPSQATADWWPGVGRAARFAERRGDVAFAIVDSRNSATLFGHRARRGMAAASTLKVMLMVAYLRQPSVRDRPLRRSDKRLLRPMIIRSENDPATQIANQLGPGPMDKLASKAGMEDFKYTRPWGLSSINAAEQTRFMLNLERYIPRRHRRFARHLLANITPSQRWGIGTLDLGRWKLHFKGGWGSGTGRTTHQVAFLDDGERRIALAILTQYNTSHDYGTRTLRGIAARLLEDLPGSGV